MLGVSLAQTRGRKRYSVMRKGRVPNVPLTRLRLILCNGTVTAGVVCTASVSLSLSLSLWFATLLSLLFYFFHFVSSMCDFMDVFLKKKRARSLLLFLLFDDFSGYASLCSSYLPSLPLFPSFFFLQHVHTLYECALRVSMMFVRVYDTERAVWSR